jgi:hypothetical protein
MSRGKPKSLAEVTHYAKVSRPVVLRQTAPDKCFSTRVLWALVLWSWCGPEKSEDGAVVKKSAKGYIERDKDQKPIPAMQKDLLDLLGLKASLKGRLSRTIDRLEKTSQVWTDEGGVMYVDPEPPAFATPDSVASTGNWRIADRVVSIGNLPPDPVARTAAIQWLETTSTGWKNDLKSLRTGYRKLLVQAISDGLIIIDERSKRSREETPSSSAVSSTGQKKAEEEEGRELYQQFKASYPEGHFDEPKAKPAFDKLSLADKRICIERVQVYVACKNWNDDNGYWIPLASNWLKTYKLDPPPSLKRAKAAGAGDNRDSDFHREMVEKYGDGGKGDA